MGQDYLERTGRIGKEAAEIAAHSTRDKKEIHSLRDVMAAHRALAAEFGNLAEAVVRAAQERAKHQEQAPGLRLRASEAMTFSRDKNFEREAVIDERALVFTDDMTNSARTSAPMFPRPLQWKSRKRRRSLRE